MIENTSTKIPAMSEKIFSVAPMMDWDDNTAKTICYGAPCAQCVQLGKGCCVKQSELVVSVINRPLLIWLFRMEVPVQQVGRNVEAMIAVGCSLVIMGFDPINVIILHQSSNATMTYAQSSPPHA